MDEIDYICRIVKENIIGQKLVKMKHFNLLDSLANRKKKMLLEIKSNFYSLLFITWKCLLKYWVQFNLQSFHGSMHEFT